MEDGLAGGDSQLVGNQKADSQLVGSLVVEDILLGDSLVEGSLQLPVDTAQVGIHEGDNGRERRALCQTHRSCHVCPFHLPFRPMLTNAIT